jgi:hypothetical protein
MKPPPNTEDTMAKNKDRDSWFISEDMICDEARPDPEHDLLYRMHKYGSPDNDQTAHFNAGWEACWRKLCHDFPGLKTACYYRYPKDDTTTGLRAITKKAAQ